MGTQANSIILAILIDVATCSKVESSLLLTF